MVTKTSATIAGEACHLFQIDEDAIARTLGFSDNWSKVRLGFRYRAGAGTTQSREILVGLDSSAGAIHPNSTGGSTTGLHALMFRVPNAASAGSGSNYYAGSGYGFITDQHGATQDFNTNDGNTVPYAFIPDVTAGKLYAFIVEIEKGVSDYIVTVLVPHSNVTQAHITKTYFDLAMDAATISAAENFLEYQGGGSQTSNYTAKSVTVTGAAAREVSHGALDRFFISCGFTSAMAIQVTNIVVQRIEA